MPESPACIHCPPAIGSWAVAKEISHFFKNRQKTRAFLASRRIVSSAKSFERWARSIYIRHQQKNLICWPPTWIICIMFIGVKTYPLWSKISTRNIHKPWKTWVPVVVSPNALSNKFGNLPKPEPLAGLLLEWMREAWVTFCIYPLLLGFVLLWQCFWQKKQANGHWFSKLSRFRLSGKGQTLNPPKTRSVLVFFPVFIFCLEWAAISPFNPLDVAIFPI